MWLVARGSWLVARGSWLARILSLLKLKRNSPKNNSSQLYLDYLNDDSPEDDSLYSNVSCPIDASLIGTSYPEIENKISTQFEKKFGRKLNWDNPQTYNEKINVAKVYMPSPLKTRLADKFLVRKWIKEKIGAEYSIPLLGVYDAFDEIDFDALPDKFVIKCNHDWNSVTLCQNKRELNLEDLRQKYDKFMKRNFALVNFEMQYFNIKPKILIEKFIDDAAIHDYRFYCFDGKPYYCALDFHNDQHNISLRNLYDMDWQKKYFAISVPISAQNPKPPKNFDEMKNIVSKLCEGFDQVRVDLYLVSEKIYFGEMTFTNGNGSSKFYPDEWNYKFGALWPFDNSVRKNFLATC